MRTKASSIDSYIAAFPEGTQQSLQQLRALVLSAAPEAEEGISYAIPAFRARGRYFIYFAGYKSHIGLYPVPTGVPELEAGYAPYKTSGKGTIQFPLDKPLPEELIRRIVRYKFNHLPPARSARK